MSEVSFYWNIKNVGGLTFKYIATKMVTNANGDVSMKVTRDIPLWFAEFCMWNTKGVSDACTRYLGEYGDKDLPDKNPFDI